MPNHVENIIALKGDERKIREMLEAIKNDDYGLGTVDFNKIIPMPESLNIEAGSRTDRGLKAYSDFIDVYVFGRNAEDALSAIQNISKESEDVFLQQRTDVKIDEWELGKIAWNNIQNYGFPTWYEWSTKNWGTKWNAYGYEDGTDYSASDNLHFQTAWTAPHPVIQKLAQMYPDIGFEHEWADEDLGANCGRKYYSGGVCTEDYYPENQKEAIEFACRIWGYDPGDLALMLNKAENGYVNIENEEYDLIELFGKPALFTSERLTDANIPKGLYCYDLRESVGGRFATVELKVTVNHAGSVITDEPIDFGEQGFITFVEDTELNFMGEKMTLGEYMQGEFEETQDESQQSGGMQL